MARTTQETRTKKTHKNIVVAIRIIGNQVARATGECHRVSVGADYGGERALIGAGGAGPVDADQSGPAGQQVAHVDVPCGVGVIRNQIARSTIKCHKASAGAD